MTLHTFQSPVGASAFALQFSPDGQVLAVGREAGVVDLFGVQDGTLLHSFSVGVDVRSLAWSWDGQWVAAGGSDGIVRIWDVANATLRTFWHAHTGGVFGLDFSRDRRYIATGSGNRDAGADYTAKVWDLTNGTVRVFPGADHGDAAPNFRNPALGYRVRFGANDQTLVVGMVSGGYVQIWDRATGGLVVDWVTNTGYVSPVQDVAISRDGSAVLSTIGDLAKLDLFDGDSVKLGWGTTVDAFSCAFADNSPFVAIGRTEQRHEGGAGAVPMALATSDGSPAGGPQVTTTESLAVSAIAVSPDGGRLITNGPSSRLFGPRQSDDGTWDGALSQVPGQLGLNAVQYSPDGKLVAVTANVVVPGNTAERLFLLDRSSLTVVGQLAPPAGSGGDSGANALSFSPDSKNLFWAPGLDIDISNPAAPTVLWQNTTLYECRFLPDGQHLVGLRGSAWAVARSSDGVVEQLVPGVNFQSPPAWTTSRDGRSVAFAVAQGGLNRVQVFDVASGGLRYALTEPTAIGALAFSPEGQVLTVGTSGARVELYQAETGELLSAYDQETGYSGSQWGDGITALTYSPDGERFFYARGDGVVACALNPYRQAIFPNHGGNTGTVTATLVTPSDFPAPNGASVTLRAGGQPDITATATASSDHLLTATFDLRGAALGVRDLEIAANGGDTRTYPGAFTVEQGIEAQLQVDVLCRPRVLAGAPTTVTVVTSNTGNTNFTSPLVIGDSAGLSPHAGSAGGNGPSLGSFLVPPGCTAVVPDKYKSRLLLSVQTLEAVSINQDDRLLVSGGTQLFYTLPDVSPGVPDRFQITLVPTQPTGQPTALTAQIGPEVYVRYLLYLNGIYINHNGPRTKVGGLRPETVAALLAFSSRFKQAHPGSALMVTGGSEPHDPVPSGRTHELGFKVDLVHVAPSRSAMNLDDISTFVQTQGGYQQIQTRYDGSPEWWDSAPDGAILALEGGHWDVDFGLGARTLTVTTAGTGTGQVSVQVTHPDGHLSPNGPSMQVVASGYAGIYERSETVKLQADWNPATDVFSGWSGTANAIPFAGPLLSNSILSRQDNDGSVIATFDTTQQPPPQPPLNPPPPGPNPGPPPWPPRPGDGGGDGLGWWPSPGSPGDGSASGDGATTPVGSLDPNDLAGPQGFDTAHWVSGVKPLPYAVYFENLPSATAPASQVIVTDHLDPLTLDPATVTLGSVSFLGQTVTPTLENAPPVGTRRFNADVDLRPTKNLIVRVNASVDMLAGDLTWTFTSIDPATGQPPDDPLAGFLDPGQEGSVLFTVTPKAGVATGAVTQNYATVLFDFNDGIDTPTLSNTLDYDPPSSQVAGLPGTEHTSSFPVQWSGTDAGSGLRSFSVYVSDNLGPYAPWLTDTTDVRATFTGLPGHKYRFYSTATDNVLNAEPAPAFRDAVTTIDPNAVPPPPTLSGITVTGLSRTGATVSWSTDLPSDSLVEYGPSGYSFQLSDSTAVTTHSLHLTGLQAGTLYHYRITSTNAGGPSVSSDATFVTVSPPVFVLPATASAAEGGTLSLNVTRVGDTSASATVQVTVTAGSAAAGQDYTDVSGPVAFAAGQAAAAVQVPLLADDRVEGPETFTATLSSPSDGSLGAVSSTTATINDDPEPPKPTGLALSVSGPNSMLLSFTDHCSNETGFRVERAPQGGSYAAVGTAAAKSGTGGAVTYTDATLPSGAGTYFYRVRAQNGANLSNPSAPAGMPAGLPAAPVLSSAIVLSARQVRLVWQDKSTSEHNFKVEAKPAGGSFTTLATPPANAVTASPGGLTPDTDYTFRVSAENGAGTAASNSITVHTFAAPNPPVNVSATALSGTQIRLLWSSGGPHSDFWQIDRSTDGTIFTLLTRLDKSILRYTDSGLPTGATRFYRLHAISGTTLSDPSLYAVGGPSAVVSAMTLRQPQPPVNLTASALSATQIRLSWNDGDTNTDYFRVERQSGMAWVLVTDVGKSVLHYTVEGLAPAQSYTFRVSAIAGTNLTSPIWYVVSAPAGPVTAATLGPPAAPTGLTATAQAGKQILLAWSDNASTETEYRVERSTDGANFTEIARLIANSTAYRSAGLTASVTYTYRVRAASGALFSAYSNTRAAPAVP